MNNAAIIATDIRPTGLVQLLNLHALHLPDASTIPVTRVAIEVADYLAAKSETDVAVMNVTAFWIQEFVAYLTIFYAPLVVGEYAAIVVDRLPVPLSIAPSSHLHLESFE